MSDLSAQDWDERYRSGNTPWDLSGPTPEFSRLVKEKWFPKKGSALVPGGGRGHDAILLAENGLQVDLVDFSPLALNAALQEASQKKVALYAYRRDFFSLPESGYHQEHYDLLLEYTFYCAIDPSLRAAYAATAAALLKRGGILLGLFFPLESTKPGPPFVVSQTEIEKDFSPYFELRFEEPSASVKPRAGREILGIFKKL